MQSSHTLAQHFVWKGARNMNQQYWVTILFFFSLFHLLMLTRCVVCASYLCIETILIGVVFAFDMTFGELSIKADSLNYSSICNAQKFAVQLVDDDFLFACGQHRANRSTLWGRERKKFKLSQWIYRFLFIFLVHFLFVAKFCACVGVALLPVIILDACISCRFHQILIESAAMQPLSIGIQWTNEKRRERMPTLQCTQTILILLINCTSIELN